MHRQARGTISAGDPGSRMRRRAKNGWEGGEGGRGWGGREGQDGSISAPGPMTGENATN